MNTWQGCFFWDESGGAEHIPLLARRIFGFCYRVHIWDDVIWRGRRGHSLSREWIDIGIYGKCMKAVVHGWFRWAMGDVIVHIMIILIMFD